MAKADKKHSKKTGFIVLGLIFVAFIIVLNLPSQEKPEAAQAIEIANLSPVDADYKSAFPYKTIYYLPDSRYYYVQQTDGEVTKESAEAIIKELYSLEAWKENGGTLGNVVIFDSTVELKEGERPSPDAKHQAEYLSNTGEVLMVGSNETFKFEPARK